AVELGIGHILHLSTDILPRSAEKVLAVRETWAEKHGQALSALIRALQRAAGFIETAGNHREVASILARPDRIGVDADVIGQTLEGKLKVARDGTLRAHADHLLIARDGATRPEPVQAAGLCAQV